jgi:hypothetical protein
MRFPLSHSDAVPDHEQLIAAYASPLRVEPDAAETADRESRSELSQTLLYGLPAAAAYLGLTTHQLRVWLEYGGPIGTIARAQGRPSQGVTDIFVESACANLEQLVAAGWLPPAQYDLLLTELRGRLGASSWEVVRGRLAA